MNLFRKKASGNKGFTLIEAIAVLIILGIIAAVAVSRVTSDQNDLIPQSDIVKSHLRYAQLKALQDDINTWSIAFTANSYSLSCSGTNCPATIQLPSESGNSHDLSRYAVTVTTPLTVTFNRWGSPGTAAIPITLSQAGSTLTFTLTGNTGFITP